MVYCVNRNGDIDKALTSSAQLLRSRGSRPRWLASADGKSAGKLVRFQQDRRRVTEPNKQAENRVASVVGDPDTRGTLISQLTLGT